MKKKKRETSWWLIIFVQAPDIYKRRGKNRRQLTHRTNHLREMTRRGQHSTAIKTKQNKKTQVERTEQELKQGGKRDIDTRVSWVKFRARCVSWSCRTVQHHSCLCWTTTRWVKEHGGGAGQKGPNTACLKKPEQAWMCGFRHFLCQVELGLFRSVLCWAGLRYQSSVVVLAS